MMVDQAKLKAGRIITGNPNRQPMSRQRAGRLARTAGVLLTAGAVLHGPLTNAVEDAGNAVVQKFEQLVPGGPTRVDELRKQIDEAKTNPDKAPVGKYVWYMPQEHDGSSSIAERLAPGDDENHAAIYDDVEAQYVGDTLPLQPLLIEIGHVTSEDEELARQFTQFNHEDDAGNIVTNR